MREIPMAEGVNTTLDSLLERRLAILAGAGLSMAPPSNLPSAAAIAAQAKQKYDATHGAVRPPLAEGIEEQAEFFFQQGRLLDYFDTFVGPNAFAGPPNPGHFAIADLLLINGIQTAATTNVDIMVETAGMQLFGQVGVGIDCAIADLPANTSPLLKLHGCRVVDRATTVWARGQLAVSPVAERIAFAAEWLAQRLLNRDLIIVGYSTDWDYLNQALAEALNAVRPARMLVVNRAHAASFQDRAPGLYALGERLGNNFLYVTASGADFLADVRKRYSTTFLRRVLYSGAAEFQEETGIAAAAALTEPPDLDNDSLWWMRRDLEGCPSGAPAKMLEPPNEPLLGLTLLRLRARGANADGPYWRLGPHLIRVLRTGSAYLHKVQAAYERDVPPTVAPTVTIAVGAERLNLPPSIVRSSTAATIARGSSSMWITRGEALTELDL